MGKLIGVTLDGKRATFPQILPHLLAIQRKESFYRRTVWRCRCTVGHCAEDPQQAATLPGGSWSVCPYLLLRSPQFQALATLAESAKISAIAGWPDSVPAWLHLGLLLRKRLEGDAK